MFDALATICSGKRCVLYVLYDDEFGDACPVVKILRQMANATRSVYPVGD